MVDRFDTGVENSWCPGCGNFGILKSVKKALDLALEWEEKIPIGVLYRAERPSFGERHPAVPGPPLHERGAKEPLVRELLKKRTFSAA